MTDEKPRATVLIVDDEPGYVSAYASWLESRYQLRTATGGESALRTLDDTVDVVLLDRRMPGMSGDEALERIRSAGYDCQIAMLTAIEPTVDIVEMPFDEYLTKPVTRDELHRAIENLLARSRLDESTRRCFSLAAKKATLEASFDPDRLEASPEYRRLCDRLESAEAEADRALRDLMLDGNLAAGYLDIES